MLLILALFAALLGGLGLHERIDLIQTDRLRANLAQERATLVVRLVLTRGFTQLGLGLALGLGGALGTTHLLASTPLFGGVSPRDPLVFAGITALLVAIGVAACWLPARRAAPIAPTEALRTE